MKNKVNPRTGIVSIGQPRPSRPPPSFTRSLPGGYPVVTHQISTEELIRVVHEIGNAIVEELRKVQLGTIAHIIQAEKPGDSIQIDGSLVDVGIGETEALRKGDKSTILTKIEIENDSDLEISKSKLKSLKKMSGR